MAQHAITAQQAPTWDNVKAWARNLGVRLGAFTKSFLTWQWTKHTVYWMIISAGTMAEWVFMVASLWMSINSSVHPFVRLFLDEAITQHITELATSAYVALPELIVGLAVVTVVSHARTWLYNKADMRALFWACLYALPTLVFLGLSLFTLGCSVASVTFEMPLPLVITRALAGYVFAFTSLLYTQLGAPQERDRLIVKDAIIAGKDAELIAQKAEMEAKLSEQKAEMEAKLSEQKAEMEETKKLLARYKTTESELLSSLHKSDRMALQGYSQECIDWVKSGIKTALCEDINRYTGHSKRKIDAAINGEKLRTSTRNGKLILVSSLIEWLENTPCPGEKDTAPSLHVVNG